MILIRVIKEKLIVKYYVDSYIFLSLLSTFNNHSITDLFLEIMKGILKIYHPDETLKYNIKSTYCKAIYSNQKHFLEVEIISDDALDHVDDDSLQNSFPQLSFKIIDFPTLDEEIEDKTFLIKDSDEDTFSEVDLYDDEDAYITDNELSFKKDEQGELQLIWKGNITDFFTGTDQLLPFRLKCECKQDDIEVDED